MGDENGRLNADFETLKETYPIWDMVSNQAAHRSVLKAAVARFIAYPVAKHRICGYNGIYKKMSTSVPDLSGFQNISA